MSRLRTRHMAWMCVLAVAMTSTLTLGNAVAQETITTADADKTVPSNFAGDPNIVAGDFNNDGYADIAYREPSGTKVLNGAWIANVSPTQYLFTFPDYACDEPTHSADYFGHLSYAGDVNGDNIPDLQRNDGNACDAPVGPDRYGRTYIIYGGDGTTATGAPGSHYSVFDAWLVDPVSHAVKYHGGTVQHSPGDVDGDGIVDPWYRAGTVLTSAFIYAGTGTMTFSTQDGSGKYRSIPDWPFGGWFRAETEAFGPENNETRKALTGVGDLNNDGQDDIAAYIYNPSSIKVFSGNGGLATVTIDNSPSDIGGQIATPIDINGDGTPDLVFADCQVWGAGGPIRVFYGRPTFFNPPPDINSPNATIPRPGDESPYWGYVIAPLGSVTPSAGDELAVCDLSYDSDGLTDNGRVTIYSGGAEPTEILRIKGVLSGGQFGWDAVGGDFNNDGVGDIAVADYATIRVFLNLCGLADFDGDGVKGACDNCPQSDNPGQETFQNLLYNAACKWSHLSGGYCQCDKTIDGRTGPPPSNSKSAGASTPAPPQITIELFTEANDSIGFGFNTFGDWGLYNDTVDLDSNGIADPFIGLFNAADGQLTIRVRTVSGTDPNTTYTLRIRGRDGLDDVIVDGSTVPPEGAMHSYLYPQCLCDCHGDPQCDGLTNVLDVVHAVNVAFKGTADIPDPNAACPMNTTDVDCSGFTNVLDVVKLVNVAFKGQTAATQFCNPCAP